MEICLLGSLAVFDDAGNERPIPGARQQALLIALALRCGEVVSDDQLIDALWGTAAPARAANALQRQISTLRRALDAPDLVQRRATGYQLCLDPSTIDIVRFDALAAAGHEAMRNGELARAREQFEAALALWRGDALADVAYDEFAQPEIARLTEARLIATEARIDADLALGRDAGLVSELEQLVLVYPLREHLRAQLMLALSRSGRRAEALRAYQAARTVLGEELGLEPSPELRALEAAIVQQEEGVSRRDVEVAATRPKTNLRTPLTAMIGRGDELDSLRPLLRDRRLLTLVGAGGVGKSRLVLELAHECFAAGDLEVWMIELAEVSDPDEIIPAMLTAIDLPRAGDLRADAQRLIEYLKDRRALVILDNCEHLVTAAATAAQTLLESCPTLRIWATSREGLAVPGEVLWPVPPLALADAVALFIERGNAADPTSSLRVESPETQAALEEICTKLDGLPLAIELAAARLRTMPIAELAAGLADRFRILNRGARTALPRQQTLRAVVDWSYDLLFDDERRVFDRLSVFHGSCALAAARVVCADDDISGDDVAELISRLVDKSLIVLERDEIEGYARCRMLQTLVDYGRDRLEESGDAPRICAAHVRYYTDFSVRSLAALRGEKQRGWLRAVTANLVNLRAALDMAITDGDAESANRIGGGLGWYWWFTGRTLEGSQYLASARACRGEARAMTRARVAAWSAFAAADAELAGAAVDDFRRALGDEPDDERGDEHVRELAALETALSVTCSTRGEFARAAALLADAEQLLGGVAPNPAVAAMQTFASARRAFVEDRDRDAEDAFRASIRLFDTSAIEVHSVFALRYAGRLAEARDDHDASIAAVERAVRLARSLGLSEFVNVLLTDLGEALGAAGEFDRARAVLDQPLTAAREVGSLPGICESLTALAVVEWRAGDVARATECAQEGLAIARRAEHHEPATFCLAMLGFAAVALGQPREARRRFAEALALGRFAPTPRGLAFALEGLATLCHHEQDASAVARLLGAASAYRRTPAHAGGFAFVAGGRIDPKPLLAEAEAVLGAEEAQRAFAAGAADADGVCAEHLAARAS